MANDVVTINLDLTSLNDETGGLTVLAHQPVTIAIAAWGSGGEVTPIFTTDEGGTVMVLTADAITDASNADPTLTPSCKGVLTLKVTTVGTDSVTGTLEATREKSDTYFT